MFIFLILLVVFSFYFFSKPIKLVIENNKYQWIRIEAEINSLVLESRPNLNLPKEASIVFPIEKCKIHYTFYYNGKYFNNNIIGLNQNKKYDNNFHRKLYNRLIDKNKVVVYVNPNNPYQSTLIRYDFNLKNIGAGIALSIFPLLFINLIYENKKYPPNYLANKIETVEC